MEARFPSRWAPSALGALALMLVATPIAEAAPRPLAVGLDRPAVAGRSVEVRVRGTDPAASVTGLVASFGPGQAAWGSSACMPPDSRGRRAGGPFKPGAQSVLAAPHVFRAPGAYSVAVRLGGGCASGSSGRVLQPLKVTAVPRGAKPVSPVPGIPVTLLPGGLLPPLPGVAAALGPQAFEAQPGLLGTVAALDGPVAETSRGTACPGARRRFRPTRRGERRVRRVLVCLLNLERTARGLRRIRDNRRANRAAVAHSKRMVRRRFFGHVGPGSLDPATRLRHSHYLPRRGGRWMVGEDLGFGKGRSGTPLGMHRAWMHSTPHRAVILNGRFRDVGLGVVKGRPVGRGGVTYTMDFGVRHR